VVVLRRSPRGNISAVTDLPDVSGLLVDQLLTSEHFGLHSTVDPELEHTFEEYYDLLARRSLTSSAQRRLAELTAILEERRQMGFTRRERMALEAADDFLAREQDLDAVDREQLSAKTQHRIREIWAETGF
jgi:hypothetical protein